MSSLLAYGQGLLAEDIGSGAGLTEPWAQTFSWGRGDGSSGAQDSGGPEKEGGGGGGGGLSEFFSVIQAAARKSLVDDDAQDASVEHHSTKSELHWDSPTHARSTPFVHLPLAVLAIVSKGTKADALVVGLLQLGFPTVVVETLLCLPKDVGFGDYVVLDADLMESSITGSVVSTDGLTLPPEFAAALGQRPQAFLARRFSVGKYDGIIFALWRDGSRVPASAEAVFSDTVQSLPMLLSNRINARKYERLGRRFDAILKVMPDAVVFVDDEVGQVVVNPAAATLLGLRSHGEVDPSQVAVAMRALTDRCNSPMDPQHWMRMISTDEELEIEEDWELSSPRRVLHVRSYPVTSRAAHGRLWIYEDVTAERDAEEAIEAANRAKSQFLAMMSHELRTPMTGVLGMLDLLHLTKLETEQQLLVRIMQESAEGLMEVINNILDFCKIEAGRLQLEEIDFSLSDMFEKIQAMVKTSSLKKELKLAVSPYVCGRNFVRGDPVRLRQVILNLMSNAIKFTEDGSVSVSWRFLDPQWVDTTVVATSQASSGKSKLTNQIISASRAEKSSVEHLTSTTGRSVIVVNCSSAGAAGRYLESSVSTSQLYDLPFVEEHESAPGNPVHSPSELPAHTAPGPVSFPVKYSLPLENRRPPEETHSFIERTSIASSELSRPTNSRHPTADQSSNGREEGQISDAERKPPVRGATSDSNDEDIRSPKYRRLSLEGKFASSFDYGEIDRTLGINKHPKWRVALDSHPSHSQSGSTKVSSTEGDKVLATGGKGEQTQGPLVPASGDNPSSSNQSKASSSRALESTAHDGRGKAVQDLQDSNSGAFSSENKGDSMSKEAKQPERVWLEVTIADSGVGIGRDQLDRLFLGPQAASQRGNGGGTGLGLAICKGLLCLMNGKIQFDSKIGAGTIVVVTVPLLPAGDSIEEFVDSGSGTKSELAAAVQSASKLGPLRAESETKPVAAARPDTIPGVDCDDEATADAKPNNLATAKEETTASETQSKAESKDESKAGSRKRDSKGKSEVTVSPAKDTKPAGVKVKVLVAEDNRVNQWLIRKMFQHLGQDVEMVGNGKLAVEAMQRTVFDLILMDVQMPILDGLSAARAIRALPPPACRVPIYALSADSPGSGPVEETGLNGYLKKPISWEVLSDLMAQIQTARNGM